MILADVKKFVHPNNFRNVVWGRAVLAGEILHPDDVSPDSNGTWKKCCRHNRHFWDPKQSF